MKRLLSHLSVGILISLLTISCDTKYTSKYTLENNSDSTLFISVPRTKDSSTNTFVKFNWKSIPAHTTFTIGEFIRFGKFRDDQLYNFKDSLYLSLDSVANV